MRNHDSRYERFECGEGNACGIDFGSIIGSVIGGGLGFLGQKESADAMRDAAEANAEHQRLRFPWAEQYAQQAAQDAQGLYGRGSFAPQANPLELLGRRNYLGYAEKTLPGLVGSAQRSWLQGLDPGLNPYVGAAIEAAQNDLTQDYLRNVMPAIADRAQAVGGYGGSRQGVAQGIAAEGLLEGLGDISTRLLSDAYGKSLQHQRAAWGAAPNMLRAGFMPAMAQQEVGGQYRGDANVPAQNLQGYLSTMAPFFQGGPNSAPYQPTGSSIGATLGGAMAGSQLGGWLGNMFGPSFNPTPNVTNPVPGDAYMPGAGYSPGPFGF